GGSNHLIGGGVIDSNYQGEILVKVINYKLQMKVIRRGDAIAQLLIFPIYNPVILEEVSLDSIHKYKSARGSSGGIVTELSEEMRELELVAINDIYYGDITQEVDDATDKFFDGLESPDWYIDIKFDKESEV
ncbi:hypothetical protein LCGC14_3137270, partial [marine sediment metagenome]